MVRIAISQIYLKFLNFFESVITNTSWPVRNSKLKSLTEFSGVKFNLIKDPQFEEQLLRYEAASVNTNYKFGILLMKPGQTEEDEIYANNIGSVYYDQFLEMIGTKVWTVASFVCLKPYQPLSRSSWMDSAVSKEDLTARVEETPLGHILTGPK